MTHCGVSKCDTSSFGTILESNGFVDDAESHLQAVHLRYGLIYTLHLVNMIVCILSLHTQTFALKEQCKGWNQLNPLAHSLLLSTLEKLLWSLSRTTVYLCNYRKVAVQHVAPLYHLWVYWACSRVTKNTCFYSNANKFMNIILHFY